MNLKTLVGWAAAAFVIWWVIEQPTGAVHTAHDIGTFLTTVTSRISHFFASL